ncbi:dolichyl-phosphate beta-glucosyltransferase [Streptomyces sp. NPDC048057]|uniref:dolichyl-phosphate beta-glucosyltransferase n=1 Tax=Streptomyces sp. NPDC048057 TaxID=3155628 RepID=UPI0033F68EC1
MSPQSQSQSQSQSQAKPQPQPPTPADAPRTADDPRTTSDVGLSIVVPAYNEEHRLRPTLDAIRAHLDAEPERWGVWELIVVDDGSTDETVRVAREAAAEEPRIHVITSPRNRGKGHAVRSGVLASYGRRVLLTDADLATPIEELDHLDKLLAADDVCAAIGSRAHPDSRIDVHQWRGREWLGRAGNRLIRLAAVPGIHDTQCGFKLFDGDRARTAFAASQLDGWAIDVEILRHFQRAGWPVVEAPVNWSHRSGSKVRPLDYGRVLGELVRLRVRTARSARATGVPTPAAAPALDGETAPRAAARRTHLLVALLFCVASFVLYQNLWQDLDRGYLADAGQDQNQWEWFFAVTADNVANLRNPLFTTLQGHPDGVNLMANTVMLGLSVPLAPVTLLLGPTVTWALVLTFGLAATAFAWYWLLARWLVAHRGAAVLGAAVAAFAPPMISHGNAHPNFLVLFMIPVILDRALRLCEGRAVVRDGVLLGLFATYQIFLGEEPLLLAAMGMLLFAACYALLDRDAARRCWRPLLQGLGWALAVCLPLVAFPLGWQFFGPQSYSDVMHGSNTFNSPRAFVEFAGRSLFGTDAVADPLAMNRTEQNAFYGWPLLVLALVVVVQLWRRTLVRALALTAAGAALLSLGKDVHVPFMDLSFPGPWALLGKAPLFEAVIESRTALICAPLFGMLVALAVDRLSDGSARAFRTAGLVAVAAALLPVVPTPYPVRERAEVPAFITEGLYRTYLGPGESLAIVPLPNPGAADALYWQSSTELDFPIAGGYFNGPWGPDDVGIYGVAPTRTSALLDDVRGSGDVPDIGPAEREQARVDLASWKAGVVVLPPQYNEEALQTTVERLLGRPGQWVGGVLVWDLDPPGAPRP